MAILLVIAMFAGFMTVQYLREQQQNKSRQSVKAQLPAMQQVLATK